MSVVRTEGDKRILIEDLQKILQKMYIKKEYPYRDVTCTMVQSAVYAVHDIHMGRNTTRDGTALFLYWQLSQGRLDHYWVDRFLEKLDAIVGLWRKKLASPAYQEEQQRIQDFWTNPAPAVVETSKRKRK